ncbi:hypothetical protein EMCRGX_G006171 [Ephydatia muelleri]
MAYLHPEEAEKWMKAIELRIKATLSGSISHKRMNSSNELEKQGICSVEGNDVCADCSAPKVMDTQGWSTLVSRHAHLVAEAFKALALVETTLLRKRRRLSSGGSSNSTLQSS